MNNRDNINEIRRPSLLDLFCKAGGTSVGYHRAGFDVVGIDHEPQPHYPFPFIQADVMAGLPVDISRFDAIAASPPCQAYSKMAAVTGKDYPDMVGDVQNLLDEIGLPYVIENVKGAPLRDAIMVCGTMFGLLVLRHRYFETSFDMPYFGHPHCRHLRKTVKQGRWPDRERNYHCVTGHFADQEFARVAMGIDWMTGSELSQAIPPAYTEYMGKFLMKEVNKG